MLKSEVDTKLVKPITRKLAHQVAWCFDKHINIKQNTYNDFRMCS